MWVRYLLHVLYVSSVVTKRPMPERSISSETAPDIPTLEDLERGVGTGDPSDAFEPLIKMMNGKITEQSLEELEQYNIHHITEHDGFGEGLEYEKQEGELAYRQLVEALIDDDEEATNKALKRAAKFMEETNLTLEDARNEAIAETDIQDSRGKRYMLKMNNALWDKCIIPYEFGEGFSGSDNVILPMKIYEYYTGFRFVEWNESVPSLYGLSHSNRLVYIDGNGCWSYVGNLRGSGQKISCCSGSTCIHEIGHAIGFMHEHQSPLRDKYLRIKWNGINPDYWSQYYRSSQDSSVLYGYYDPTSVMHYWNGGFGINHKHTFTTMDPDLDFLVAKLSRHFYFFEEAMDSHNCLDLFCDEKIKCENGGYHSVIKGDCTCLCPEGLDPKTNCTTRERDVSLANVTWPAGSFTTLNTVNGCPAGFEVGWQYHLPPDYVWGSNSYHAKPHWSTWHAEHEFCSRIDDVNDGPIWPSGSYCIFRKGGRCPSGFDSGNIQMDDAPLVRDNNTGGELPDGVYGNNTRWEFCCRQDGPPSLPIELPVEEPFILFCKGPCQKVAGMKQKEEYFTWRSDTADNYTEYNGYLPTLFKFSHHLFNFYFSYYTKSNKDCGGVYRLNSSHKTTPLIIQSPDYPYSYGSVRECHYTVLAPEGTQIQIDFSDFEVDCNDDSLEIAFSMPGQSGNDFCGSGFKKTIISSENYVRLSLKSGYTTTAKGFSVNLTLIDDESSCFKYGKRSYSGDVNYTKNFEPCLPWNEVQNCRFHRFTPETFDDDLSENFCRNTGLGTGPWCYTNADTCARDYCDACSTNCDDLIACDSQFCSTNLDGQALRGCRKTCGECKANSGVKVTCSDPGVIDYITPSPVKTAYSVGETVEYLCPLDNGTDKRVRTCTASGKWTDLGFVCGACPEGWGMVEGKCFKWFDQTLTYTDAKSYCANMSAMIPVINSQNQVDHIIKIANYDKEVGGDVWIALQRITDFEEWDDCTTVNFTKWGSGQPKSSGDCVKAGSDGVWVTYNCNKLKQFVCMHTPTERTTCADQSRNCEAYIRATPDLCVRQTDFAYANCPYSCGMCTSGQEVTNCSDTGLPPAVHLVSSSADINVGQIYEYECNMGYALLSGNLIRACLVTGQLTGTAPICQPESTVEEPVNNVNIRRRKDHGSKGRVYTTTNQDFNITKNGNLTKWRFYSTYNGDISLQVWRFLSNSDTSSATFIGENTITETGDDRIRTVEIPEAEQISVQAGDVIAIHYPKDYPAGISYTRCDTAYEPNHGNQLTGPSAEPSSLVEGNNYIFSQSNINCKTWSLNAFIK